MLSAMLAFRGQPFGELGDFLFRGAEIGINETLYPTRVTNIHNRLILRFGTIYLKFFLLSLFSCYQQCELRVKSGF